jgi:hypothetical protein
VSRKNQTLTPLEKLMSSDFSSMSDGRRKSDIEFLFQTFFQTFSGEERANTSVSEDNIDNWDILRYHW